MDAISEPKLLVSLIAVSWKLTETYAHFGPTLVGVDWSWPAADLTAWIRKKSLCYRRTPIGTCMKLPHDRMSKDSMNE